MGMMNVIVREGWHDDEFVDKACSGFEALAARLPDYPPERVGAICGLSPHQVVETARFFARNQPSRVPPRVSSPMPPWK
jgi:anaerobic selenocysteine-containing dehydrogenase